MNLIVRSSHFFFVAIAVSLSVTSKSSLANSAAARSHCAAAETNYFSCEVRGGKVVSVCAGKGPTPAAEAHAEGSSKWVPLQYRFGRPGKIELSFPQIPDGSEFMIAYYSRLGANYTELEFSRNGATYTLGDYWRSESGSSEGLVVSSPGRRDVRIACVKRPSHNRLDELVGRVPCNAESALSLGSCERNGKDEKK